MTVGLIKPNEGKIFLDQTEITDEPMYKRAQMGVGYLAQEASVFRKLSVEDNIRAVLEMTSKSQEEQREKLESEFNELEFLAPLDSDVIRTLNEIKRDMLRMPLDGNFKDYIDPKNYLFNERSEGPSNVQPLPPQPMPDPKVVQQPQPNMMQSGLTPTESALLSESEKVLRLKQRGLA
jgi:hypothetical protein